MPVLNEENYIESAVSAILAQAYPGNIRVVLALGPSTDRTNEIVSRLQLNDSRILVVDNPSGRTPDGLNAAIAATTEPILVRVDAHSELSENYLTIAVETLARTGADNVGGLMAAEGVTLFERAVATAMTSKLGVGSAAFHVGGSEGPAETVYLGVFNRLALERVGGYDPSYTRAQDWEMNYRIRKSGGTVWFTPDLKVIYRPRPSFPKLAKQYFQYGQWRRRVMQEHPETRQSRSALRYFAAPSTLIAIVIGTILGAIGAFTQTFPLSFWGFAMPVGYFSAILLASLVLSPKAKAATCYLPLVLVVMQLCWGAGFIRKAKV